MLTQPKYVHVAGTNGKGSVTANLQSVFATSGLNAGAFFSPYVVDPRERVQIGRELISPDLFAKFATELFELESTFEFEGETGIPEFEFKTAIGFSAWKYFGCEWIALEVGLGGRYDATNVVTPQCSVIVSIGLDHVQILGNTLAEIAGEKAGIIKPGVPVVMGDLPQEAREVVERTARDYESPLWRFGKEIRLEAVSNRSATICTPYGMIRNIQPGLVGSMQIHNAALAVAAIQLSNCPAQEDQLRYGIESAYLPGRFQTMEFRGRQIIVDGAHNADASIALATSLRQHGVDGLPIVFGMVGGHNASAFFAPLAEYASRIYIVPIDFQRAIAPSDIANQLSIEATICSSLLVGIESAMEKSDGPILITGSLYLAGEAIRLIQN